MIYKVVEKDIRIWDFEKRVETIIPYAITDPIYRISVNSSKDKIAIYGGTTKHKLYIFDIKNGDKILEIDVFNDFHWHKSDSIIFSNGNSVNLLSLSDKKSKELFKFSRIKMAPINMTISPDSTKVAFIKWKGNDKKLCVYDMINSTTQQYKPSLYRYSWVTSDQIVYHLGSGIKVLEFSSGKNVRIFKNVRDILNNAELDEDMYDLLDFLNQEDFIINKISDPMLGNNRLFYAFFIASELEKRVGIISTNLEFTDSKLHFYSKIGLIDKYFVINEIDIIGIRLTPNNLIGEKFETEIKYYNNKEEILEYRNYQLIWNSNIPT